VADSNRIEIGGGSGRVLVPASPHAARLRLAELEADATVTDAIMDPKHPLHEYRLEERRSLQIVAARKT
jgi:hypothetical protein